MKRILLGTNPQLSALVWRHAMGWMPYGVSILIVIFAMYRGLLDPRQGWLLCTGMSATVVCFYIALRSGWSQRFQDPGLPLAGVLVGMSWTVLVYVWGGAIHVTQLLFLGLVMGMAVFSLSARQLRMSCLYGVATMGTAIVTMAHFKPDVYPPKIAWFYLALLLICLPTLMAVGMQRVKLTLKLNRQKSELSDALGRLKEIAIRDALTGLYNRGHMIELLTYAVDRQQRTGEMFSFVMFDLDFFKRVNDTHGHGTGDKVLAEVARRMRDNLRAVDLVARYGGEEFLVAMPDTTAEQAQGAAERSAFADRLAAEIEHGGPDGGSPAAAGD